MTASRWISYCASEAEAAGARYRFARSLIKLGIPGSNVCAAAALNSVKFYRREARAWRALQTSMSHESSCHR